uniref:Tail tape measure n=1 Tax=Siphoviridae sp. ctG8V3 TaxID=2827822 RepID=A0A8S5S4R7_9CAUD|nr:MAG TPA: tail tape measure [Siphoviridae sp. ctG8V3]
MAESFSVKAILSAQDKGFTSAFKSAMGTVSNLKSTLTSGIGFGIMAGIGQKAFGAVTSSIGGMVSELNSSSAAWKTFNGNMSMVGKGADEIASVKKELQEFAEDTIYSASDMASTYAQLSAVGIKSTNKLVKGFGGLAAAAENPKQAMKTLSQQATQMAAKPTVAWEDFRFMLEQTPAGIAAVAKKMGMSAKELTALVKDGQLETEAFFDAIAKVGTNDAFTKLATEYKTVDQAMDGLTETVSNKLAPSFDVLSGRAIKSLDGIINKIGDFDGNEIAGKLTGFLDKASGYWNVLKTEALEVKIAFGDAFSAIGEDLGKITGAFGSTESISSFSSAMDSASGALKTFAGFLEEHSEIIAKVISKLPQLFVAYKGFKIAKSVAPFVGAFTSAIAGLAGAGISKIAGKLFGISKGQEAVGKSSAASSKKMLASAKAFMMLGAGVALISGGFFLLAQGAKAVADSGPLAVAVLAGMVGAVLALSFGFMSFLKNIKTSPAKMNAASKSFTKMAFAVSAVVLSLAGLALALTPLASLGDTAVAPLAAFGVVVGGLAIILGTMGKKLQESAVGIAVFAGAVSAMALSMTPLAKTGTDGAVAMGTFGVVVGGLVAVFAVFGTALTAAIPAMLAFGATILMVGAGMSLATPFVEALGSVIQILGDVVVQVIGVITGAIVAIFPVFGNFVSTVSDSVSQIVSVVGNTLVNIFKTAGDIVTGVIDSLGDGFKKVTDGISKVIDSISGGFSSVLDSVAGIIDSIGSSAKNAGKGFESVADGINTIASLSIVDIAKALGSVAIGLGEISTKGKGIGTVADGLNGVIGAITIASAQISMFSGTLTQLNSTAVQIPASMAMISGVLASFSIPVIDTSSIMAAFASISAGAAALAAQLDSSAAKAGAQFSKSLTNGMNSAANSVQRGVSKITSSANKLISALTNIATQAMSRFNSALSSGASRATSTARSMSTSILSALNSTSSGAYSCGVYIGQGLAKGMASTLGYIRSVAAQMAAAADAAVRAKAKIHSPSRVFAGLGAYVGEGFALGIESMSRKVAEATQDIVDIPTLSTDMRMRFSGAGDYELSGDHSYSSNATYTIVVPVEYNGREAARVTAEFTQKDLERRESMKLRLKGERSHV